jgi:tetratricopeptide (TPR) repeat protein
LSPAEKIYAAALAEVSEEGETIPEDQIIQVLTAHAARLRTREVELAPRDLVKRRVLETAGEREYRFAVELFRRWVRLNKPVRDVKDELDRIEPVADRLYEIGRDYFNRRQWGNAVRFFEDSLNAYSRHFRARLYLGETLMEQGHVDEAVIELQKAYELDRDEARLSLARAFVAQAEVHEKSGDEEGALVASEKALEVSPHERTAQTLRKTIWERRSSTALAEHRLEDALYAYQKAGNLADFGNDVLEVVGTLNEDEQLEAYDLILQTAPGHPETLKRRQVIWLRRGEAALERNDLDAAFIAFQKADDEDKINRVKALRESVAFASLAREAEAHARAGRWTEALAAYERLIAEAPDEESRQEWQTALERCREEDELAVIFRNGAGALTHKDWQQAQHAFAGLVHRRPDYQKNGRFAASLLEQAVTQRRVSRSPWLLLIAVLLLVFASGLAFLIIETRDVLRTREAELAEAYFEMGKARREQGDLAASISQLALAIELAPNKADYYTWRGIAYRDAGDLDAAMADHNHAVELDPENANHYLERACTYRVMGNLEAALANHDKSISLNPAGPALYAERAVTYQVLGDLQAALADYNRALELDPNEPYIYYLRGVFYRDFDNQPDQAVRDFEKFLELADRNNCPECTDADLYIKEQQTVSLTIPNSSFETGSEWFEYDPNRIQTFEYDTSQAHSDERSLKIVTTGTIDHWVGNNNITGWEPGGTYWLSVFVKAPRSGQLCLQLAAKEGHEVSVGCATATSDWQIIRGTVTVPSDATHFLILLRTELGTVYVDDVQGGQFIPGQ